MTNLQQPKGKGYQGGKTAVRKITQNLKTNGGGKISGKLTISKY